MPPRFRPGDAAYAKDGSRYLVEEIAGGIVYCSTASGAETEFPEAQLATEAERAARAGPRSGLLYERLKQSRTYLPYKGKLARAAAEATLAKAERLCPGLLDFVAFVTASRAAAESQAAAAPDLSIVKCREIFESASPETRTSLLAAALGTPPEVLASATPVGDNLMRAMIEKGLAGNALSFDEFRKRRRT